MTKKEKKETYKRVQELTKELISCLVELEEDYLILTPNDEKHIHRLLDFQKINFRICIWVQWKIKKRVVLYMPL